MIFFFKMDETLGKYLELQKNAFVKKIIFATFHGLLTLKFLGHRKISTKKFIQKMFRIIKKELYEIFIKIGARIGPHSKTFTSNIRETVALSFNPKKYIFQFS